MPQTWDEHGNVIASQPAGQVWDEHGNSVQQQMPTGSMQTSKGGPIINSSTPQEGLMTKIGRGGLLGMASGAGIPETQHPVMDLLKGLFNQHPNALQWADPTAGALSSAVGMGQAEVGSGQEAYQGVKQRDPEMIAHGVASGVTRPAMFLGGGEKAGEAITGGESPVLRGALGIGPNFIKEGAEKLGNEHAGVIADQQAKINQAKVAEPQAFAEAEAKHQKRVQTVQQANAESQQGFNQRQQHLDTASQHAQTIADKLPELHQAAREEAGAAYGDQPRGTYEAEEIKNLIADTAKTKLQGNTQMPTALTKILKDIDQPPPQTELDQASVFRGAGKGGRGQGKGYSASDALENMDPKARAKYLSSLSDADRAELTPAEQATGKTPSLDAPRMHGFMSELGRAAQSGSLNADEASAINATRTALEGRLRKLYENENRLGDFQNGQAKWKQMANTFENSSSPSKGGSPLAQALQTKDPVTGKLRPDYVQSFLSGDKSHTIATELMKRYSHLGAPTSELEAMKTHGDLAETLPSKVKEKPLPAGPDYPNFTKFGTLPKLPEGQTLGEFDPVAARKVALKQKSSGLNSGGPFTTMRDVQGITGLATGNPLALKYGLMRRALASGLSSAGLTDWLSKATPEEMAMAKEIPASKVAIQKAKAYADIPKPMRGGSTGLSPVSQATPERIATAKAAQESRILSQNDPTMAREDRIAQLKKQTTSGNSREAKAAQKILDALYSDKGDK